MQKSAVCARAMRWAMRWQPQAHAGIILTHQQPADPDTAANTAQPYHSRSWAASILPGAAWACLGPALLWDPPCARPQKGSVLSRGDPFTRRDAQPRCQRASSVHFSSLRPSSRLVPVGLSVSPVVFTGWPCCLCWNEHERASVRA